MKSFWENSFISILLPRAHFVLNQPCIVVDPRYKFGVKTGDMQAFVKLKRSNYVSKPETLIKTSTF